MRVLLIEDDTALGAAIRDQIAADGHSVDWVQRLDRAGDALAAAAFDLVLLDLMLPDGLGIPFLRALRARGDVTPVIILTALDQVSDRIAGLNAGGDDYLSKPFALKEVEARLIALQRRRSLHNGGGIHAFGGLSFDVAAQEVRLDETALALPPKAIRLIDVMLQQPQRVFSRRELEIAVWGHEQASSDNLRSVLHTVRKALAAKPSLEITNVHGLGYKLVAH